MFSLLSVLAYVRGRAAGSGGAGWRWASVVLYGVALGFKAVPVGLPLVLLVLDMSVLGRRGSGKSLGGLVLEKLPFLLPAVAASWMAIHAKAPPPAPKTPAGGPARAAAERAAAAGYGLVYYLETTAWPHDLSAYHFRPDPIDPDAPPFAGRIAAVAALGAAAYLLRRSGLPAALLCYAILEAPNLGLVPHGLMLVADRYAYVPTMPLFVLAALWMVRGVAAARWRAVSAALIVAIGLGLVAMLAGMSRSLCRTWRDSFALWRHALEVVSGRDAMLESNIGIELFDAGRVRDGMAHLRKAVEIDPADADARENLGVALLKQGDPPAAIVELDEAVQLAPRRGLSPPARAGTRPAGPARGGRPPAPRGGPPRARARRLPRVARPCAGRSRPARRGDRRVYPGPPDRARPSGRMVGSRAAPRARAADAVRTAAAAATAASETPAAGQMKVGR